MLDSDRSSFAGKALAKARAPITLAKAGAPIALARASAPIAALAGVLALLLVAPASAQQLASAKPDLVDAVVASVDGAPITLVDLEAFSRGIGRLLSEEEKRTQATILEALVRMKVFDAEFERQGIKASDADVDIYIDNLVRESNSSRERIREELARAGVTWDEYFERIRQEMQRMVLINREIRARVNVTPEEVERAYEQDPAYMAPEKVEIGHIFMPIPERASQPIVETVRATADQAYDVAEGNFGKAAKQYSKGPNADEGGILGTFERGELAPGFQTALAALEEGGVSRPFEEDGAFHIVKLVKIVSPRREPLDDATRKKIEDQLYSETMEARFRRWVDEDLLKRHHVTKQLEQLDELLAEDRS